MRPSPETPPPAETGSNTETVSAREKIRNQIQGSIAAKQAILESEKHLALIEQICQMGLDCLRGGGKILFAGNGGSAADAQHLAAELVGRYGFDRPGVASIALTTDTSILTAVGNDYSYDDIFSRQVQALGTPGDLLVGISTSGNSGNILKALRAARDKKMTTVGFTGRDGGQMTDLCDACLIVPARETAHIQETHIMVGHIFCDQIERGLFTPPK